MFSYLRSSLKEALIKVMGDGLYQVLHAQKISRRLLSKQKSPDRIMENILHLAVERGAVCLDIGAHTGDWVYPMSRCVGPEGKVFAFEALPHYAEVLQRALVILGSDNVTVFNVALSNIDGYCDLISKDEGGRRLTGRTHVRGVSEKQTDHVARIRSVPLDVLAVADEDLWRVQFIKCDVEGAELWVFEGGRKLIERARPLIFCEVQDEHCARYGHNSSKVFELLDSMGYTYEQVTSQDYLFKPVR